MAFEIAVETVSDDLDAKFPNSLGRYTDSLEDGEP